MSIPPLADADLRVDSQCADTREIFAVDARLEELFPDDPDELRRVAAALRANGETVSGGGAAPAVWITLVST